MSWDYYGKNLVDKNCQDAAIVSPCYPHSCSTDGRNCPGDAHFTWEKDGVTMESCVREEIHPLADGNVHLLSWVRDIATRDAEYHCTVKSKSGMKSSKVLITVSDTIRQDWSHELAKWRSAVSEHNNVMEGWKKTWESCNKKGVI